MTDDFPDARRALETLGELVARVSDTYAERCDIDRDRDWSALKLAEETGELVAANLKLTGRGRRARLSEAEMRQSLEDEAADVFAMLVLYCRENSIDLVDALDRKWFRYLKD